MKKYIQLCILACVCLCQCVAYADGKAFGPTEILEMADQQAVVIWQEGVETLVIDTAIQTQSPNTVVAGNMGWVVPIPASQAELVEVSSYLLPVLQQLPGLQPKTRDCFISPMFVWILVIALLLSAGMLIYWLRITKKDAEIHRQETRHLQMVAAGAAVVLLIISFLSFPFWGNSRIIRTASSNSVTGVTIQDQKRVGALEMYVVSDDTGDAIVDWLQSHHFQFSDKAKDVLLAHAKEGRCFAVSHLSADEVVEEQTLQRLPPLAVRFKSEAPIYPMRLTGVDQEAPLDVSLYICETQKLAFQADAFITVGGGTFGGMFERYRVPSVLEDLFPSQDEISISHLRGRLQPKDMQQDVMLNISDTPITSGAVHWINQEYAIALSMQIVIVLIFCGTCLFIFFPYTTPYRRRAQYIVILGIVGVSVATIRYISLPIKPDHITMVKNTHNIASPHAVIVALEYFVNSYLKAGSNEGTLGDLVNHRDTLRNAWLEYLEEHWYGYAGYGSIAPTEIEGPIPYGWQIIENGDGSWMIQSYGSFGECHINSYELMQNRE